MSQSTTQSPVETYEEYLVPGVHGRWAPLLLHYAQPKPGERVLDLACGTGIVARHFAPLLGAEGSVIGLDVSAEMLAVAARVPRPHGAPIEWRQGEASALPDGPFDLVVSQQGLQFFADRLAALRETRRVLRPGGRLALNVFRPVDRQSLYLALFQAVAQQLGASVDEIAKPFSLGDADELRRLLGEAGFEHVEVHAECCMARFPSPDRFLALTITAAASVVPAFGTSREARLALIETVKQQIDETLDRYVEDDVVSFPTASHIVLAR